MKFTFPTFPHSDTITDQPLPLPPVAGTLHVPPHKPLPTHIPAAPKSHAQQSHTSTQASSALARVGPTGLHFPGRATARTFFPTGQPLSAASWPPTVHQQAPPSLHPPPHLGLHGYLGDTDHCLTRSIYVFIWPVICLPARTSWGWVGGTEPKHCLVRRHKQD